MKSFIFVLSTNQKIMKRLLMIALLLLPVAAFADSVKADKAHEIAQRFLGVNATKAGGNTLSLVWRGEKPGEAPMAAPAYYVYNIDGGGFVIVSGEDSVRPILAYSTEGSFRADGMPDNLAGWMSTLRESILAVRASGQKASTATATLWSNPQAAAPGPAYAQVGLETAKWAQDGFYGSKCPVVDGKQSVTGCVPAATAIIMRFHKHPSKGSGTLPGYTYKTANNNSRYQEGHALGAAYDWDNMPLNYAGATDAQKEAVANLMFDLAVMVHAQFNSADNGGTPSLSQDARSGLINYMGYDPGITRTVRGSFGTSNWFDLIKAEIDAGRPLLYEAQDPGGAMHVFVVDGYDTANSFIRCNWGWGGMANGFYSVDDLSPSGTPRHYTQNHVIYTGLMPRDASDIALIYKRFNTYSKTSVAGETFNTKSFGVSSLGGEFDGYYGVGLFSKDGDFRGIVSESKNVEGVQPGSNLTMEAVVTVPAVVYPNDMLRPCYSGDGTTWKRMYFDSSEGGTEAAVMGGIEILTDRTDFEYDAAAGKVVITTFPDVTWTFKTGGGADMKSRVSADNGVLTIYAATLDPGRYVLTLSLSGFTKTIAFTL